MLAAPLPSQARDLPRITYEEFLNRPREDHHAEWVDGKVVPMSPVNQKHQAVGRFLIRVLSQFVEMHDLGELWIKVEWLWQEPLPPLLDVLKQWKLI